MRYTVGELEWYVESCIALRVLSGMSDGGVEEREELLAWVLERQGVEAGAVDE